MGRGLCGWLGLGMREGRSEELEGETERAVRIPLREQVCLSERDN